MHLFPHSPGGWKPKIKMLAGSVSPEASLLGLQMSILLLCPDIIFPCACAPLVSLCVCLSKFPLLIRTAVALDQGLPSQSHFYFTTSLKTLFPVQSHPEVLGVRISTYEFWRHNSVHNKSFHPAYVFWKKIFKNWHRFFLKCLVELIIETIQARFPWCY